MNKLNKYEIDINICIKFSYWFSLVFINRNGNKKLKKSRANVYKSAFCSHSYDTRKYEKMPTDMTRKVCTKIVIVIQLKGKGFFPI